MAMLAIFDDSRVFLGLWVLDECCASMGAHLLVVWIYAGCAVRCCVSFWVLLGSVMNSVVEKSALKLFTFYRKTGPHKGASV